MPKSTLLQCICKGTEVMYRDSAPAPLRLWKQCALQRLARHTNKPVQTCDNRASASNEAISCEAPIARRATAPSLRNRDRDTDTGQKYPSIKRPYFPSLPQNKTKSLPTRTLPPSQALLPPHQQQQQPHHPPPSPQTMHLQTLLTATALAMALVPAALALPEAIPELDLQSRAQCLPGMHLEGSGCSPGQKGHTSCSANTGAVVSYYPAVVVVLPCQRSGSRACVIGESFSAGAASAFFSFLNPFRRRAIQLANETLLFFPFKTGHLHRQRAYLAPTESMPKGFLQPELRLCVSPRAEKYRRRKGVLWLGVFCVVARMGRRSESVSFACLLAVPDRACLFRG